MKKLITILILLILLPTILFAGSPMLIKKVSWVNTEDTTTYPPKILPNGQRREVVEYELVDGEAYSNKIMQIKMAKRERDEKAIDNQKVKDKESEAYWLAYRKTQAYQDDLKTMSDERIAERKAEMNPRIEAHKRRVAEREKLGAEQGYIKSTIPPEPIKEPIDSEIDTIESKAIEQARIEEKENHRRRELIAKRAIERIEKQKRVAAMIQDYERRSAWERTQEEKAKEDEYYRRSEMDRRKRESYMPHGRFGSSVQFGSGRKF